MQTVISEVRLVVQSVFSNKERVYNVQPLQLQVPSSLQLQVPSSLQPPLMLTEYMQTLQGSGSSTCAESTPVGTTYAA
jgi:hypothetical protein